MAEVKLLHAWASPFVMRVKIALALKSVEYTIIDEDLRNKSELLLSSNPVHKKVPVLIHNEKPVCESLIIVEYIDEAWPEDNSRPGFFPKCSYGKAIARFWADFIDKKFVDSAFKAMRGTAEEKEKGKKDFVDNAIILDGALSKVEGPFFNGTTIGFADIALSPFVIWLPALIEVGGLEFPSESECPHLHKWFATMKEEPVVMATLPDVGKLTEFVKMLRQMWSAPPK